ncbi:MAG: hypothetical protein R3227_14495 [Reinekea sp.]|nr:hypothetical protein [Reinekea sp.]
MNQVSQFLRQYQLQDQHVYLLELIPLIKMIWADGSNQEAEIDILKRFAMNHLAVLSSRNEGVLPISVEATNDFMNRFIHAEPSQQMLDDLNALCAQRLKGHSDLTFSRSRAEEILNFCIDIAAACAAHYPYEFDERIVEQEKKILKELVQQFTF